MLLERVTGLLDKMQPSAQVQQIHKLICCPNSKTRIGDFWSSSEDDEEDEVEETFNYKSQVFPLRPLRKTETTVDDDDKTHSTVRTIPWTPTELVKIREKYSR